MGKKVAKKLKHTILSAYQRIMVGLVLSLERKMQRNSNITILLSIRAWRAKKHRIKSFSHSPTYLLEIVVEVVAEVVFTAVCREENVVIGFFRAILEVFILI